MEKNTWPDCNTVESVYTIWTTCGTWLKTNVAMVAPITFGNFDCRNRGWFDNFCPSFVLKYSVLVSNHHRPLYLTAGFGLNWHKISYHSNIHSCCLFPWLEKELMVSTFMTASSLRCLLCSLYCYIAWFATKCTAAMRFCDPCSHQFLIKRCLFTQYTSFSLKVLMHETMQMVGQIATYWKPTSAIPENNEDTCT